MSEIFDKKTITRRSLMQGMVAAGAMSVFPMSGTATAASTLATAPSVRWNRQFGGTTNEEFRGVAWASNGGYVAAGVKRGNGLVGTKGWLVRTDAAGKMIWQKTITHIKTDTYFDEFNAIVRTNDGGYALAGNTYPAEGWLVKTDARGRKQWQVTTVDFPIHTIAAHFRFNSLAQTSDGGYILGGQETRGAFAVKVSANGGYEWSKTFPGPKNVFKGAVPSQFNSAIQTKDGGFAFAGEYLPTDGPTMSWFVKTNSTGRKQWSRTFGSDHASYVYTVIQTRDGGYALGGQLGFTGDWVMRTNSKGNKIWKKVFNEPPKGRADGVYDILEAKDGSFVCVGSDYTVGWIRKMSSTGAKQWHRTVNGREEDGFNAFTPASGGGYVCAGYAQSATANNDPNGWLVKIGGK